MTRPNVNLNAATALQAAYGTVYDCPKCGRSGYYKPPYNTLDECMSCRWKREHP